MSGPSDRTGKLLRLAHLREEVARRALAVAARAVADRQAGLTDARATLGRLRADLADRHDRLTDPLIGSPQLRGALAAVLTSLEADRDRKAEAEGAVALAQDRLAEALATREDARAALVRAGRLVRRRAHLHERLEQARARLLALREEQAGEDFASPRGGAARRAGLPAGASGLRGGVRA